MQGAAATTDAVDHMEQFDEILLITVAIAAAMALLIAYNAIIGALGTAVGIAGGRALLSWLINTNMPETMPEIGTLTSVAPLTYVLALVTGTFMVAVAPLLTLRRLRRTDLSGALRVVE